MSSITPASGGAGTILTIGGLRFGSEAGFVTFALLAPGAPSVTVTASSWAASAITVTVPSQLTAGGAALVTVTTAMGREASRAFTVHEPGPPTLTAARGLAQTAVTVYGSRLGGGDASAYPPAGVSVTFDGQPVAATSWASSGFRFTVPAGAAPGGHTLAVATPWGSASTTFTVGARPTITAVTPPRAMPDTLVTVTGSAFGGAGQIGFGVSPPGARAEVESWTDTRIVARMPGLARVDPMQSLNVIVTTEWGSGMAVFGLLERSSITSWTRLEPHARTEDLEEGLRLGLQARTYDAAWLLARQWQLREFAAEDAGSPVQVHADVEVSLLGRWRPGQSAPGRPLPPGVPLETLIEREPRTDVGSSVRWSRRLAVESGLQFLRMLADRVADANRAQTYRDAYVTQFPVAAPTGEPRATLDAETVRFLDVASGRAVDGARLHVALRGALPPPAGTGTLPATPPINAADRTAVLTLVRDWYAWCDALLAEGSAPAAAPSERAWDASRLEYSFAVSADTGAGEAVLSAREYAGDRLEWHHFVLDQAASLGGSVAPPPPSSQVRVAVPTPAAYPGMPAERWWQFEDARIDFGNVDAGPADLARLLLVEFATVFGNDWFVIPIAGVPAEGANPPIPGVTVGSVVRMRSLTVVNTFGEASPPLLPLSRNAAAAAGRWRLFELAARGQSPAGRPVPAPSDLLFLPPLVIGSLESVPVEEVALLHDELANLAWGVERTVESPLGRPLDRLQAYEAQRQRAASQAPPAAAPLAPLVYRLATSVPDFWIPLVRDGVGRLVRAALTRTRPDGQQELIAPLGRILEPETPSLAIYEEEVPRAGLRVVRAYQYARAPDGTTFLWLARRKLPGRRDGGSGLQFDVLEEPR